MVSTFAVNLRRLMVLALMFFSMIPFPSQAACYNPRLYIGLNTRLFANDPVTDESVRARNDMAAEAGVTFTFYSPTWKELEPSPGVYQFAGMDTIIKRAQSYKLPVFLDLKIIDSNQRAMPADLMTAPFDSTLVRSRLLNLLNAMVPHFQGSVPMVVLGNEANMYLRLHQTEATAYTTLYKTGAARLKALVPGIPVSVTLTAPVFYSFPSYLLPLLDSLDYISTTYYPLGENYQVREPSVSTIMADFAYIKAAAHGKRIIFQEIGYPSSYINGSSDSKQAQFIMNSMAVLKSDSQYLAASYMALADLSDTEAQKYSGFYGVGSTQFAAYMKTIGFFSDTGHAKQAWNTFHDLTLSLKKSYYTGCTGTETINVFPNPWKTYYHAGQSMLIDQLPAGSTLKILNSTGDAVKTFGPSSGPALWSLTNQLGQPLGTGAYYAVLGVGTAQKSTKFIIYR